MLRLKLMVRDARHRAQQARDRGALHGQPWYGLIRRELPDLVEQLRPLHTVYTREVSAADMAVSLPTAALLLGLCQVLQPATILDLGSGFSSSVFRRYAASTAGARVTSVDDNPAWLETTRAYLLGQGLMTGELVSWADFSARRVEQYAFVFHDLGDVEMRRATMAAALNRTARDGMAVLDDLHKHRVEVVARPAARAARFRFIGTRELTLDSLGRFATVALPLKR